MNISGEKLRVRVAMDRKIVDGLRAGKSLTSLAKECGKGKGLNTLYQRQSYVSTTPVYAPTFDCNMIAY